jgi:acyl-CoA reductase-like NAD-dependent aldehyde dehydrogenase
MTTATIGHARHATTLARHWIDGQWRDSAVHKNSINPATGDVIGRYALGGEDEARVATAAAVRAFRCTNWKDDRALRSRALQGLADRFDAHADGIIQLLSTENGKLGAESTFEVGMVASAFRYYAALVLTEYGRVSQWAPGQFSLLVREPIGVAGISVPWNAPVALLVRSLAPALAAGCTAVVKMPSETAQVNTLISEVISEVSSVPPGVVNILTGEREVLSFLVKSPDVPTISFTGSTRVGRAISEAGAPRLKRFGLELGGKTPMLVFADADVEAALPKIEKALTVFGGQFCMTGSRLLVHSAVADAVRHRLAERLTNVRVGPASDPTSDMGPMINKANVERVNQLVEDALRAGAKAIVRGGPATEGPLARGAFYRPTLLEVTDPRLPIVQEEVFGPVLTMQVFETEAQAIALANDSEYGLAASLWTRDVDRPLRIARELQAGTVWVNDWVIMRDEFEEGGYKQSGRGRLRGLAGMDDFLEYKHIVLRPGAVSPGEPPQGD